MEQPTQHPTAEHFGITFDDVVEDPDNHWSQICQKCTDENDIPDDALSLNPAYTTCGVEGCYNNAEYYIDFPE